METMNWKVDGMTCANCALTISKYLEKEGLKNVKANPASGEVLFDLVENTDTAKLEEGLESLGYQVAERNGVSAKPVEKKKMNRFLRYVLLCAPFTLVLMLHMFEKIIHIHWLMNPWVQLGLCIPVYVIGMSFFGRSAWKSIRNGMPNMNVLVAVGATAAFVYSLYGTLTGQAEQYLFYETAATIITLVFLGNYLEDASVEQTQRALNSLAKSQKVMANMIAFDDQHHEQIFPVENTVLHTGDLILIKSGEQIPADCKILWGEATVNEAIITGESLPLTKKQKDQLIGGSILVDGTVKAQVTATAKDSVLSNIVNLVKQAQGEKPPVQQLADKISAIFVPIVLGIALVTLAVNWIVIKEFTPALMRSIAVLVIACPCAMGLATPAAIAVGLGRAAKNGVLFRNAKSLELFKNITQVVFDKTGTLTTGNFVLADWKMVNDEWSKVNTQHSAVNGQLANSYATHGERLQTAESLTHHSSLSIDDTEFKRIVYSLEKYSNHPIAACIASSWKTNKDERWASIEEIKGFGMKAVTKEGVEWIAGSYKAAAAETKDETHNVYVLRNGKLVGWVDVKDEVRAEAKSIVQYLKSKNIKTILLSGDRQAKSEAIAKQLGIDEVIAEQTPEQKLEVIERLNKITPTAMVGDGINDAPALAKATIGISLSEASQVAMQTADVVLMNHGLKNLPLSLGLGKHTFITIKQNLFWAFCYNIVAIPVAAFGLLTPTFGALVMGLSDVVLAINSVRLFVKRVV
ncbi:heavy metal translocating P-type ATPase [Lacibacter sediminis]|uniref:Cation-translocating P-type ATPase n=1 Tax=Lacibacter sediminis TaxID=2760713 RepID=A0A7G5XEC0_9BACT|nr:cation-translocating P-type ATPase [Lacibacter sediminis]QNA43823.1 cation-translocating P-type ATPase [Lacibacter sediminis]